MKAAVLSRTAPVETKPLKISEVPKPKVGRGEVLVKVQACGVCHTDVHIVEGSIFKSPKLPVVLGHEVVGIVEEVGSGVQKVKLGDRVGVSFTFSSCMECRKCLSGNENLCPKKEMTGYTRDGGYAEYAKFNSNFVVKVPEKLKSEEAAPLFCAGITAYRAVKRVDAKPGENVAVVGIGGLGGYAVQFAKLRGCKVFAFSRDPEHLKFARRLGADEAIDSSKNLMENIRDANIDVAFIFAPSANVLEQVMRGIGRGGRVVMAGNIEKTNAMSFRATLSGEKVLTTVTTGTIKDIEDMLQLAAKGKLESHVEKMKLEEANDALIRVKVGDVNGRIVLVS